MPGTSCPFYKGTVSWEFMREFICLLLMCIHYTATKGCGVILHVFCSCKIMYKNIKVTFSTITDKFSILQYEASHTDEKREPLSGYQTSFQLFSWHCPFKRARAARNISLEFAPRRIRANSSIFSCSTNLSEYCHIICLDSIRAKKCSTLPSHVYSLTEC